MSAKKQVNNTFQGGLNLDTPNFQTPSNVYTYSENITFVTHDGNELIFQNEKGTELVAQLKENYIPIANKSYGGISYIISAELNSDGEFTGRGEIGSFPSPQYDVNTPKDCSTEGCNKKGILVNEYRAFQNYSGDSAVPLNPQIEPNYGEFNSQKFNFQIDKPVEIVAVQPSYDDTVNVIFTDDFNKPKIINSRFSVRPNDEYLIINRTGSRDANLYDELNFNNTLNHIFTSDKLAHVSFNGQNLTGGNLPIGMYRYFFKYGTADGNLTDIIAETNSIPVFFGDSVATTRGGITNENTTKSNKLFLQNLDTAYASITVYYTYSTGTVGADADTTTFLIEQTYNITSPNLEITHTGFENVLSISNEELSVAYSAIDTYKTGTEVKGRLAIANITTKQFNSNLLRDFAREIQIYNSTSSISIPGLDVDINHSTIYNPIAYDAISQQAYEGAYYNPRNVHDHLGYWGGETYMFGAAFVFEDGTYSPVFPIRGHDNINGGAAYTNHIFDSNADYLPTGENVKGIYRFPSRDRISQYLSGNLISAGSAKINKPEFKIPDFTTELSDEGVIGIRFFRSRRKIDCVGQGILFDTAIVPITDSYDNGPLHAYKDAPSDGWKEFNSRYIPAFNYILETAGRSAYNDELNVNGDGSRANTSTTNADTGVEAYWMYTGLFKTGDQLAHWHKKKFTFISPDFICNPIANQRLYGSDNFTIHEIGAFLTRYAIPTVVPFGDEANPENPWGFSNLPENRSFTLIKTSGFISTGQGQFFSNTKADYVTGGTVSTSTEGFSSAAKLWFLGNNYLGKGIVFDGKASAPRYVDRLAYSEFWGSYNDYVGITTENQYDVHFGILSPQKPGQLLGGGPRAEVKLDFTLYGTPYGTTVDYSDVVDAIALNTYNFNNKGEAASKLVNLYQGDGPRSTALLETLHNPETEAYYPISQPYYFNNSLALNSRAATVSAISEGNTVTGFFTVENLKNSNGNLSVFGGDCFVNMTHRRLYISGMSRTEPNIDSGKSATNVGYTMAFVAESNYNVAGRYENIVDINEGNTRSFHPYLARDFNLSNLTSNKSEDNDWRVDRLPETKQYNTGYDKFETGKNYVALSSNLPFIQNNFDTRIWISDEYVSSSFINGYRYFQAGFRDYPKYLGEITSIKNFGGNIFCIHEYGTTLIPVSERVAGVQDSAGDVFFQDAEILASAKYIRYISDLHGSQWQFSVVQTDNAIYGIDMNTSKIWRYAGGTNLELISDMHVQSFLRSIRDDYDNRNYKWFETQIRSYFDKRTNSVLFTFARSAREEICGCTSVTVPPVCPSASIDPSNTNVITITGGIPGEIVETPNLCYDDRSLYNLVYNELPTGKWKTFNTWYPINMFTIHDKLYSYNIKQVSNRLYQHYVNDQYSFYYDETHGFTVEVNVTSSTMLHQVYDNIMLVSNQIYPEWIEYTTDSGTVRQTIRPRNVNKPGSEGYKEEPINAITLYDAVYKEDHMYITIAKDIDDTRLEMDFDNRRIRDKYCKIRIHYNTTDQTYIQAIITFVTQSF